MKKTVLDIGAGSRIVGLSTLLSLTSKVDFKEVGPFATESIRLNLKVNNLSHNFQILSNRTCQNQEALAGINGALSWLVMLSISS